MAEKNNESDRPCPLECTKKPGQSGFGRFNVSCSPGVASGSGGQIHRKWQQRVRRLQNRRMAAGNSCDAVATEDECGRLEFQPSNTNIRPGMATGIVSFKDAYKCNVDGQPYMSVSPDTPISDVISVMEQDWRMTIPTIVLEIISGVNTTNALTTNECQLGRLKHGLTEAANRTNMWIVTHGLDVGMGKLMGDTILKERIRRQASTCQRHRRHSVSRLPRWTLLGMVQQSSLQRGEYLDGKTFVTQMFSEGNNILSGKYDLNPYHTHFIIVRDCESADDKAMAQFTLNFANFLRSPPPFVPPTDGEAVVEDQTGGCPDIDPDSALTYGKIPIIALFIAGGCTSTSIVADRLRNGIPVVVVKGSGGAADILSFAYQEIKVRNRGAWDPDYVDNFIPDQVSRKIAEHFSKYRDDNIARNRFRDKILECVELSHKDDMVYLDFLDIPSSSCDLTLLNEHLLQAMFRAEHREIFDGRLHHHLQKDVYLALDWNCPRICDSQVFRGDSRKHNIEPKLFERALILQDREYFVEMFLDRGFKIYPFLTRRRYCRLFERAENPGFYRSVCLESALGYSSYTQLDECTLIHDVNWMIFQMTKTKNFVTLQEYTGGQCSLLDEPTHVQERHALNALVIWAVLMNRFKLAKMLWKRADYPIHLALLVSTMYEQLSMSITDKHAIKELQDHAKEFALMADGVLCSSFDSRDCRAMEVLSEEVSDYNFRTAVEMAALSNNRSFIAQPCAQKWLTALYYGDIRIRDLKLADGLIPEWVKILLSAFLLFPMNIWIIFRTGKVIDQYHGYGTDDTLLDSDSEMGMFGPADTDGKCTIEEFELPPVHLNLVDEMGRNFDSKRQEKEAVEQAHAEDTVYFPFWKKIATLWGAPITKFWTHQVFYILYLTLFSLAVAWPSCGNYYLDVALWCWTLLILFEDILVTYVHYWNFSSIRLITGIFEIILISLFLVTFMFVRILAAEQSYDIGIYLGRSLMHGYGARVVMCLGLLYFFYRYIWIYFPIDPTLGRLLFRLRLMVVQDFMHFQRLALLFIVSSGISIHAVIYPDYPMSWELIRRIFHKAWFTLFTTPIEDLHGEPGCRRYHGSDSCRIGPYENETCPVTGIWPYLITIQYLIILKLILITLLFALFGDTANKLAADADAIWRYQRYHLVLDFCARPRLPAPLNIISFIIILCRIICRCPGAAYGTCRRRTARSSTVQSMGGGGGGGNVWCDESGEDSYWRGLAYSYLEKENQKSVDAKLPNRHLENISSIIHVNENVQACISNCVIRIDELDKSISSNSIMLEEIGHLLHKEGRKFGVAKVHLLSRQSPYPNTRIRRFPLADRYVAWEVHYSIYDPVIYTKPKEDYSASMRDFVDDDLMHVKGSASAMQPNLQWNFCVNSSSCGKIDRKSWMTQDDKQCLIYRTDAAYLPMNPMGRTGLRGRGCLHRWGPNHSILAVITRWSHELRADLPTANWSGYSDDQKSLEVILTKTNDDSNGHLLRFPGGFEHGEAMPYDAVRKFFDHNTRGSWDADSMEKYFGKCAKQETTDFTDVAYPSEHCDMESKILFRGYVDDTRNTDNSWVEAEVWHFHYTSNRSIDISGIPNLKWKKYSLDLEAKMLPSHANILREILHKLENAG